MSAGIFSRHAGRREQRVLQLAFSEWRPGTLLNILQCTGQPPSTELPGPEHPTCRHGEVQSRPSSPLPRCASCR